MYKSVVRKFLFQFDPEKIHHFTFSTIKTLMKIPLVPSITRNLFSVENPVLEKNLFGLKFKNSVGLAAGFDKNALLFDEFANYGFGFVEIGTVTPKPQPGNPKKRIFRLREDEALINRMGFNNDGVDVVVERLKKKRSNIIIGGNIGKNKVTPNERAIDDYLICFEKLFEVVDYFVVNVSSPNTPNLRALQDKEPLTELLQTLQDANHQKKQPKPILLKIAPDLTDDQLKDIIDIVSSTKIAGVIATNTTISREGLESEHKDETGGLSGKPVKERSTEVIRYLADKSNKAFPIIGVGGIHSEEDAKEKLEAGADLVQLYTGFIYEGPGLVKRINKSLLN
ncbi:quinone-dependent dihydroorotate dehydrogenase [Lutimonas zeaxanthinifaciens]|uniref:quinone-dependent dihydroorotate dehydrogenase n=1 Tax=Lutimonas zeaxanthinifaciens TaxID=3060215 RepID=UPI00265D07EE|nr:quinone-dependent dihydroorotate dehydrogenase [Lutimonas sp. YSD2104]WKK65076.1 quinone-dependent dihydroorotate dehydrogenase [Lutimonas sp. YSD2104]